MMNEDIFFSSSVHIGRNIKRLREILGVKQGALALEFQVSQQTISDWESKAQLRDEILERVAKVLNIPMDSIKNFNKDSTLNVIANTFHKQTVICHFCNQQTINQIDKLIEMVERLLKTDQEKNRLLEKILAEKKNAISL